ncbi:Uu.00g018470.m01.CDS01 [Anthostomella pinea]|uniref:Uu.00g018470.m01.CDS01 n=1 Tax=Anthostomella pinea TaxID=933095 RepID=A0AAI8YQL8_9PEZI|nr:Uu.00g018470.m01.CDS01 [Anthostomella pinea]
MDAVARIVQNDELDEPAKIDAIAVERGWFSGKMDAIDNYLAGDGSDAAATAAKLAAPIDEAYSTADHGRALYEAEITARNQRRHWSLAEALDRWGPEEDIPQPGPETADLPTAEGQLWDLWYSVLHAAKRNPWTDETQQSKLVDLVKALKARPDPAQPSRMTAPLKNNWIWTSGSLWSTLPMLGPSAREMWNDSCGFGAGWTVPEQHAETNVHAFVARLTASGTSDFTTYARWALCDALETNTGGAGLHHHAPRQTQLAHSLTLAAVWIHIAGKYMRECEQHEALPGYTEVSLDARGKILPWSGKSDGPHFSDARWDFWRRRFDQEAHNEELPEEVRLLAAEAAKTIQGYSM